MTRLRDGIRPFLIMKTGDAPEPARAHRVARHSQHLENAEGAQTA